MLLHGRPIVRRPTLDGVTRRFRFRQVDVFTDVALSGNPLAVFTDADGLTDGEMQALAREMNLSETAFVLPPTTAGSAAGASHRLRIFTPGKELPFAGHPAIGAAWILADEGLIALEGPRHLVRQEMAAGVTRLAIGVAAADGVREAHRGDDVPPRGRAAGTPRW